MAEVLKQEPDPRPGAYYISVVDHDRYALLAGPYPTHQEALDRVDRVRTIARVVDPKSVFYGFGTCRIEDGYDYRKPGKLNHLLGEGDRP